jgi:hypothetical protein
MKRFAITATVLLALAACGEKPQTGFGIKSDVPAFQGAENPFAAPGWKAGDKSGWEQALKARAQNTQNDYAMIK